MKHITITLQTEILVSFSDIKKAKAFFIDGDWKETFYEFSNVNELSEHIAMAFRNTSRNYSKDHKMTVKFIEGFGEFVDQINRSSIAKDKEFGEIHISTTYDLQAV